MTKDYADLLFTCNTFLSIDLIEVSDDETRTKLLNLVNKIVAAIQDCEKERLKLVTKHGTLAPDDSYYVGDEELQAFVDEITPLTKTLIEFEFEDSEKIDFFQLPPAFKASADTITINYISPYLNFIST